MFYQCLCLSMVTVTLVHQTMCKNDDVYASLCKNNDVYASLCKNNDVYASLYRQ